MVLSRFSPGSKHFVVWEIARSSMFWDGLGPVLKNRLPWNSCTHVGIQLLTFLHPWSKWGIFNHQVQPLSWTFFVLHSKLANLKWSQFRSRVRFLEHEPFSLTRFVSKGLSLRHLVSRDGSTVRQCPCIEISWDEANSTTAWGHTRRKVLHTDMSFKFASSLIERARFEADCQ